MAPPFSQLFTFPPYDISFQMLNGKVNLNFHGGHYAENKDGFFMTLEKEQALALCNYFRGLRLAIKEECAG